MALALLGYFGTMLTALTALIVLLNGILGSPELERTKPQPHPRPAIAQAIEPEQTQPTNAARLVTTQNSESAAVAQLAAAKSKRLKIARYQNRKALARQREEQNETAALGYAQEANYGDLFGPFSARRF